MRPTQLAPLFASLRALDGIGPRLEETYAKMLGRGGDRPARIVDLLFHLPVGLVDRRLRRTVLELRPGEIVTVEVEVLRHAASPGVRGRGRPYRVFVGDETGEFQLIFFHAQTDYLKRLLPVGSRRIVSGQVEFYDGMAQIAHPDHVVPVERTSAMPQIEAVYPLTAGLTGKMLQKAVAQALRRLPELSDWLDPGWRQQNAWPSFADALRTLHEPSDPEACAGDAPARRRLAYDELLANQLALALVRRTVRRGKGRELRGDGRVRNALIAALPFTLTGAQQRTLAEIDADLAAPHRMLRLIQGDVGSGKTVVALLAMATAIEAGTQATLMAPTELLARQHWQTLQRLGAPAGLRIELLTGRERGKSREVLLPRLAAGEIDIIVGTHALFQPDVTFRDLGLVVIDEQHRFGVHQRLALQGKGERADALVMTATPIPRTLLLTHYGDMDVSRIDEKPPGRRPIDTRAIPDERLDEVVAAIARAVAEGAQAYWVCPLVEESESLDVAAAEARFSHLEAALGEAVGLVHGRMRGRDKDAVMEAFAAGSLKVLVATTVIEVGVDVPNATLMVIEHAERFGLAQLHQLRGRIGRGDAASTCLLLYHSPLSESAKARLEIMRATEDGFRIAEEDLRLRGGGETLGTRQSGLPEFRVARLPDDAELLAAARDDARLILDRDEALSSPRGEALRSLLYLFDRNEAVRLIRAG